MMENKIFRWIAFVVSVILAITAIAVHTFSGFLCFVVSAFIFIPFNHLPEKLDSELDPKYRKRATIITAGIFLICGLLAFTTAGSHSNNDNQIDTAITTTTTTRATTTTKAITTTTTTTATITTTASTSTIEAATTTTEATTAAITEAPMEAATEPALVQEPVAEEPPVEAQPQTIHFVLNAATGCVHADSSCSAAQKILPENYSTLDIPEDQLSSYAGVYWACGKCAKRYSSQLPKF